MHFTQTRGDTVKQLLKPTMTTLKATKSSTNTFKTKRARELYSKPLWWSPKFHALISCSKSTSLASRLFQRRLVPLSMTGPSQWRCSIGKCSLSLRSLLRKSKSWITERAISHWTLWSVSLRTLLWSSECWSKRSWNFWSALGTWRPRHRRKPIYIEQKQHQKR